VITHLFPYNLFHFFHSICSSVSPDIQVEILVCVGKMWWEIMREVEEVIKGRFVKMMKENMMNRRRRMKISIVR
jgi:hypothetical protein